MSTTTDLLHPERARAIVLDRLPRPQAERIVLAQAHGRFLAEDVVARDDHPPFPASTMDGYAIVAVDVSPWREVTGTQVAGPDLGLEVSEGYAVKIMTGAPLPKGADAVIPIEQVEVAEDHIVIEGGSLSPGAYVRPVGSDLAQGETILTAGTRIGPVELGLIATMGYAEVSAARRPRVAVISTGDELVEPGTSLAPGMISDSNRFSLEAAIRDCGAEVVHSSRVSDDYAELQSRLSELAGQIDVLVTSGGVSVGDRDVVKTLLGETAEIHFSRVFMKPGKPLTFATAGDLVIFGLPGNPVSSMVSLELFVRPALLRMMGAADIERETVSVALANDVRQSDRIEYQRAVVTVGGDGRLTASTTGNQISSRLLSMLGANVLLIIDAGDDVIPAGQTVPAMLLEVPRLERSAVVDSTA